MTVAEIWPTVLGGLMAGLVGVGLFFLQRSVERGDVKKAWEAEALREFAEALTPLLIELDRGRYDPSQATVWVGKSRQLPKLGTWIFDPEENARKAPDWDAIGQRSQVLERLWRDRLSAKADDAEIDRRWTEASDLLFHLTRPDGANARAAAERAEELILSLLEEIQKRNT